MDKVIDARFERLEKALGGLIDSVAKYHPSTSLAEDLMAADAELSKGLEQGKYYGEHRCSKISFANFLCPDLKQYANSLYYSARAPK